MRIKDRCNKPKVIMGNSSNLFGRTADNIFYEFCYLEKGHKGNCKYKTSDKS